MHSRRHTHTHNECCFLKKEIISTIVLSFQEVRDNMQQITEELDKIQYRVEMINSCKIIPKFKQFHDDKGAVGGKT